MCVYQRVVGDLANGTGFGNGDEWGMNGGCKKNHWLSKRELRNSGEFSFPFLEACYLWGNDT